MTAPVLFEMYRGDDRAFLVRVTEKITGDPVNLTGWRFFTTMKRSPVVDQYTSDAEDETALVKVTSPELSDANAVLGLYQLLLPNAQTRNLGTGLYYFDIQRELLGVYTTAVYGRVRVNGDVTRRYA